MGIVREELQHKDLPVTVSVIEREPGEVTESWRFISLEVDDFERMTPRELASLGRWLMETGKRLGRERVSNGAARRAA